MSTQSHPWASVKTENKALALEAYKVFALGWGVSEELSDTAQLRVHS